MARQPLLRSLFAPRTTQHHSSPRRCSPSRRFRPALERLEDRIVFSTAYVDLPFQEVGELAGAEYDISVPQNWNGTLLVLAPGGGDAPDHPTEIPFAEFFDDPIPTTIPQTQILVEQGYAIASVGYSQLGWQVEAGIRDVENLKRFFRHRVGSPDREILVGLSLGSMIGEHVAEQDTTEFDGAILFSGFGTGAQNVVDRMLATRLAYDILFAGDGGFLSEWGTVADVRDEFDPDNEIYPLDFETEVSPVILPQFFDLDPETGEPIGIKRENFGKWEFMRLVLGQPEDGLNQQTQFLDGQVLPAFPFIPMFWATEFAQTIERRAGGPPAQNLDHLYALSDEDKSYLATLGVDADGLLRRMNARTSFHPVDEGARNYLGRFFTPSGRLEIPVLATHQSNDVNIPVQHRHYYEQLVRVAGRSDNLVQAYVNPGGGHSAESPEQIAAAVNAMNGWIQTGRRPDPANDTLFPAALGFDASFEPSQHPFIAQPTPEEPRQGSRIEGTRTEWHQDVLAASSWGHLDPTFAHRIEVMGHANLEMHGELASVPIHLAALDLDQAATRGHHVSLATRGTSRQPLALHSTPEHDRHFVAAASEPRVQAGQGLGAERRIRARIFATLQRAELCRVDIDDTTDLLLATRME